jgi:hypothetical protein
MMSWTEKLNAPERAEITRLWRVLDAKTPTTKRLSFGAAFVAEQRAREGLEN